MDFLVTKNPDFEALLPLWQEAFGDSRRTAERYFAAIAPYSTFFAITEENVPVSMLFAVEEQVLQHKIAYLYAVATAKSHRGQGLAARLLAFAEQELKNRVAACILCPAEPSLAAYYARLGYEPWSAANTDLGCENTVPQEMQALHKNPKPVFTMAKLFDPDFPKSGTFRYEMG